MSNNNNTYERTDMIDPPLKVRGSLFVRENIRAVTVDVFGHLSTKSSVSTSKLKVSGDCTIGGNCKANQVNNLGVCAFKISKQIISALLDTCP